MHTKGSCKAHEEKLTNKLFSLFCFVSLLCASRAHDEKGTFYSFSSVFDPFRPCKHMRKHAFAGENTQHHCSELVLFSCT